MIRKKNKAESGLISDYRRVFLEHSPCEEGESALRACSGRKDVFDLVVSPVGMTFFVESIRQGWGPSTDEVMEAFRPYANGAYTARFESGSRVHYAQMWCGLGDMVVEDGVRCILLVGRRGKVTVPDWQVVKLIVDANCYLELECGKNSLVWVENHGGRVVDHTSIARIKNI